MTFNIRGGFSPIFSAAKLCVGCEKVFDVQEWYAIIVPNAVGFGVRVPLGGGEKV